MAKSNVFLQTATAGQAAEVQRLLGLGGIGREELSYVLLGRNDLERLARLTELLALRQGQKLKDRRPLWIIEPKDQIARMHEIFRGKVEIPEPPSLIVPQSDNSTLWLVYNGGPGDNLMLVWPHIEPADHRKGLKELIVGQLRTLPGQKYKPGFSWVEFVQNMYEPLSDGWQWAGHEALWAYALNPGWEKMVGSIDIGIRLGGLQHYSGKTGDYTDLVHLYLDSRHYFYIQVGPRGWERSSYPAVRYL